MRQDRNTDWWEDPSPKLDQLAENLDRAASALERIASVLERIEAWAAEDRE